MGSALFIIISEEAIRYYCKYSMNQDETNILKANLLRINARNLRAKVRSMLPLDICCKYKARNMLVKEIDYKKKTW